MEQARHQSGELNIWMHNSLATEFNKVEMGAIFSHSKPILGMYKEEETQLEYPNLI